MKILLVILKIDFILLGYLKKSVPEFADIFLAGLIKNAVILFVFFKGFAIAFCNKISTNLFIITKIILN